MYQQSQTLPQRSNDCLFKRMFKYIIYKDLVYFIYPLFDFV